MPEIEDEDRLEARLIFNRESRIYQYSLARIGPRDPFNAFITSQSNRGVEAACIEMLWRADPAMTQFTIETPEKLDGEDILARIERQEKNLVAALLNDMERGMEGGRSFSQDDDEQYDSWLERTADILMVLEALPDQGPLEKYADDYPEAVNFIGYHAFEAEEINNTRRQERTLFTKDSDDDGGSPDGWRLTDSFWERAMIHIRVQPPLFARMAEFCRREEGPMPPAP